MEVLSVLEKAGEGTYDRILPVLADMAREPTFETPKNVFSISG